MSATAARIEANRANATFSTGPRTAEGKQRSASNALKHGLTARTALLPEQDQQAYQEFCANFREDLKPKGTLEVQLVQSLADSKWRLNRCRLIEQSILDGDPGPAQIDSLNKLSLYEHRLTRNFHTTLKQFLELKAERKQQEERDMKNAAQILNHLRSKQIAYDPAEDGFVFSAAELEVWARRHQRIEAADLASHAEFSRRIF